MSRNIRQKYPASAAKATKRRGSDSSSSLNNLSDDEGYSGVDEVSDSEDDDEENVNAAEEEHIISREWRKRNVTSPRPCHNKKNEEDEEDEEEEEAGCGVVEEEEAEDDEEDEDEENAGDNNSWAGILSDIDEGAASDPSPNIYLEQDANHTERHVRFAGVPDSDSDSTTTETTEDIEEFFPDIFVEQSSLDPAFRREIESDPDDSSNSGTYWDYQGSYNELKVDSDDDDVALPAFDEGTPVATPSASRNMSNVSTPSGSTPNGEFDGYESDGDTTEEDVPEPPTRRKQSRRHTSADPSSDSDVDQPVRFRRGHPRVGRFNLDGSDRKPIAVVNPISRRMMIFTPQRLRRLDLAPESFSMSNHSGFDLNGSLDSSPILSNSATLMLSAMFSSGTFGDFMNTQAIGPAEAFFPFSSDAVAGDESELSEADDEADEAEDNLKLEDFITFHAETSDDDEGAPNEEAEDMDADWDDEMMKHANGSSRPHTASTASDCNMDDVHPLLNHFSNNSDAVGAFRRNQINQQLIFSDKATQDSLAFSGPYYQGTLRGIKSDSFETVTTPITPVRRQKRVSFSQVNMNGLEITSPTDNGAQKRKASNGGGEYYRSIHSHKRHRSTEQIQT